ncbi:MAG: GTP 3',8-cyclase MoaA [Mariprofundus sp.]|nr:GTP 3',8-cyclase MoaA [Mariprofundus sp.]
MKSYPLSFYPSRPATDHLIDRFDRQLSYLRISVTDRCNMRCDYCRPEADLYQAESHAQVMRYEEIERIVRLAAEMGVNKVRITGGEPLVRRDLVKLIKMIAAVPGIDDLSMTTNATLLKKYAKELADAGLKRINISMDSLNPLRFRKLTGGELAPVLAGIDAAMEAGIEPIKINTVLLRGINAGGEHCEVAELIDFALSKQATIRFIELMPMKQGMAWEKHYISTDEILQRPDVRARVDVDAALSTTNSAARYLPLKQGQGEVGFIMPMSERFCEGCNRLRLTADGGLRSCLPEDQQLNLRDLIRAGGSDEAIRSVFRRAALLKPEVGSYDFSSDSDKRSMISIGG